MGDILFVSHKSTLPTSHDRTGQRSSAVAVHLLRGAPGDELQDPFQALHAVSGCGLVVGDRRVAADVAIGLYFPDTFVWMRKTVLVG